MANPGAIKPLAMNLPQCLFLSVLTLAAQRLAADAFPRATPESQGVSSEAIRALASALDERVDAPHSLMLLRHGNVIAEGWWEPTRREDLHILYSLTKSFNATGIGLARDAGLLDLDDPVAKFFPEVDESTLDPNMRAMRIRDLLTMTTGHVDDTMDRLRAREDGQWARAFLNTAPEFPPGIHFRYNSGASYMLTAILQRATGEKAIDYLRPRLLDPLGIGEVFWGESPEGVNLGGGGMMARTEDIARFGQLYLQKGVWRGKRILSEGWVEMASDRQTSSGSGAAGNWNHGYGFQFWRNKPLGYRADGAFGQFCFILPERDLVLAITSGTGDMGGVMDIVWETLLPTLSDEPLPENPSARARLEARLASLSLPTQEGAASSRIAKRVSGKRIVFTENEQGIEAVTLDFGGERAVATFEDQDGTHAIACGYGAWAKGKTDFNKRISNLFDYPGQSVAGSGGWTAEDTFVARIFFSQTPYRIDFSFRFEGDAVYLDAQHNLRWGETKRPQIVGTLE